MSSKSKFVNTLISLKQPKVAVMLALGFSSGLPFLLVGNTLGFWLRESGVTLATIGFLSWVGLAYSFKFLWAPIIDKIKFPILGKWLGLRRGWLLFSQILIMVALFGMSAISPAGGLMTFTALAALAAFASATQDIIIDAWRIEVSESSEDMALLSSAFQLGYRGALLLTDALILILAAAVGWSMSYTTMAAVMSVGLLATYFAIEPVQPKTSNALIWSARGLYDAILGPFINFFLEHKSKALMILAAVSLYRLADFVMGPMNNPFYTDLGITKETVGAVRGSVGLITSLLGVTAGGICAVRFGMAKTLLIGAIVGPISNLAFSLLALVGPSQTIFAVAMGVDNFSGGFAGTALIGYMSSLTGIGYTATQYALLSSFYTLLGKFLKGFSGVTVDTLKTHFDLMTSYALFFAATAAIGIPAVLLCLLLVRDSRLKSLQL
jgi:MFS transporter, PAT family, beta-lactamase induction signal transducer AmpG